MEATAVGGLLDDLSSRLAGRYGCGAVTVGAWLAVSRRTVYRVLRIPSSERWCASRLLPDLRPRRGGEDGAPEGSCWVHEGDDAAVRLDIHRGGVRIGGATTLASPAAAARWLHCASVLLGGPIDVTIRTTAEERVRDFLHCFDHPLPPASAAGGEAQPATLVNVVEMRAPSLAALLRPQRSASVVVPDALRPLHTLEVTGALSLPALRDLVHLRHLRTLRLTGVHLGSFVTMKRSCMPPLTHVYLTNSGVTSDDLGVLAAIATLTSITLDQCRGLTSLRGLGHHPRLETVCATNCTDLSSVHALGTVTSLQHINLSQTRVPPPELEMMVRGSAAYEVRRMLLCGCRLPSLAAPVVQECRAAPTSGPAAVDPTQCSPFPMLTGLSTLNIANAEWRCFQWVLCAVNVQRLVMDHTELTAVELEAVCAKLLHVEVLHVGRCHRLHTTLQCALSSAPPMGALQELRISENSLTSGDAIGALRAAGVRCDVLKG